MSTSARPGVVSGWGRASAARVGLVEVTSEDEVVDALATSRPALARGRGRSYGDAAQCAGGTVLDCRGLGGPVEVDPGAATVRAAGGVGFDELLETLVPLGWFLPVTPGTSEVTVGGAIAADVHGKNHHRDGAFGAHVESMRLVAPSGTSTISPASDPEAFWATVGGMGLTGVVTEATFRLLPIETSLLAVDTERAGDLDTTMERLSDEDDRYRYSVAWVDCLARGRSLGRSVLTLANHARRDELEGSAAEDPLAYGRTRRAEVPVVAPVSLVNSLTMRPFNELWFRKAPARAHSLEAIRPFFYPLDALGSWNRLYGRRGFTQYQFVVPFSASGVVREAIELLQARAQQVSLAVLKRFGAADPAPLGFPVPGWTLALDLRLGDAGLGAALDELDGLVAAAGGRVYLAKDGRLRPELLETMYPRLREWREVRDRLDPERVLTSDLARRLGLLGEPTARDRR